MHIHIPVAQIRVMGAAAAWVWPGCAYGHAGDLQEDQNCEF